MTVEDLTLSQVGPSVEGLLQLMQSGGRVDWAGKGKNEKNIRTSNSSVSKISDNDQGSDNGAGDEDQQQVQLAYLGSLEEMRAQLQRMAQFYQDDLQVLLSLTTLLDRVDEALNLVSKATQGYTKEELGENVDGSLTQKEEESILNQSQSQPLSQSLQHSSLSQSLAQSLVQSLSHSLSHSVAHSLHQSLHKSTLHSSVKQRVLGISILLDRARLKAVDEDEEEEESDGSEWDEPLTEAEISQLDSVSLSPAPTDNLRQSFMEVPPPPEPAAESASSSSSSSKRKNKGKCEPVLCKICYDEFTDCSEIHTLDNCEHIYCKECLQGYLTTQITNGGVLNLDCPHPECDSEINILDIYALCDAATLDKYERFVVLAALRADPDVRWCPMPNCSAGIKGPPKDNSPWITCTNCQLQVCFACGDERHDPVSCGKEAKELIAARRATVVESEELFEAWHKGKPTGVKACPKCKAYIEKNLGCNHMTCQSCKHQFCWLCLSHYESSHYNNDSFPDCKGKQYWTPPIVAEPDPELQARYNWIYFPPNYQYAGVGDAPLEEVQREQRRQAQSRRIKTRAKKVGLYVGVGVAVATLGIPAAIIGGPIYGVFKLHKAIKAKRRNQYATEALYI